MSAAQILVCNCGSSSVKVDVFDFSNPAQPAYIATATAERIGTAETFITVDSITRSNATNLAREATGELNHSGALRYIANSLMEAGIFGTDRQLAVGHRIVHGGPYFKAPVLLNADALKKIERCIQFAPLHNPANLSGIHAATELFAVPQVGAFDTSFHGSMPDHARTYAIPYDLADRHGIQRYGFHGLSHEFVAGRAAEVLGRPLTSLRLITLHMGNGVSGCAIRDGKSIDTSMGFTPLEGFVMGTRSGDLDPAIPALLMRKENRTGAEIDELLNRDSGLKGIGGVSDMRDLLKQTQQSEDAVARDRALLARDVFCYRAKKYIGAYLAALNGCDAIVFTGGIGENAPEIRARILQDFDFVNLKLDNERNQSPGNSDFIISTDASAVAVLAIPTDEELIIAQKTYAIIHS